MKRKCLAVGIILLFVGVAVAPSINFTVVKASNDNDLVEITTQACGIQGFGNTTVKLTREQYNDLERYLVEFRAKLNQTISREEAIPIFKEVVVELNKYGLLPKGMSVDKMQKLVTGEFLNKKTMDTLERLAQKKTNLNNYNFLCLISGHIFDSLFVTLLNGIGFLLPVLGLIIVLRYHPGYGPFFEFLFKLSLLPLIILTDISFLSPISIAFAGVFTGCNLLTIGLLGVQHLNWTYEGSCIGFTGLRLLVNGSGPVPNDVYLLGFSLFIGAPG